MISKIHIKNFKLLRDVTLRAEQGSPIVLIGPNCSGKSSILEVLDLLSYAMGHGFQDAIYKKRQGVEQIRTAGEKDDIYINITIESSEGWPTGPEKVPVEYSLLFTERDRRLSISSETIKVKKRGHDKPLTVLNRKGANAEVLNIQSKEFDKVVLAQEELAVRSIQQAAFYPTLGHVKEVIELTRVYPGFLTSPSWARDSREQDVSPRKSQYFAPTPRIGMRGFDLITALYSLSTEYPDTSWPKLKKHFISEFPFVKRLFFPPDPGGGYIVLAWEDERFPGVKMYAEQMSEGMISYLCLLSAILVPDLAAALAFDEPGVHIHPSAIHRLVSLLEDKSQHTTVIMTTHSDNILDYLTEPAKSLHICKPTERGTSIEQLDEEMLEVWRKQYKLSELREKGQLDPSNKELEDHL